VITIGELVFICGVLVALTAALMRQHHQLVLQKEVRRALFDAIRLTDEEFQAWWHARQKAQP
jgi:hypothetical protein